MSEQVRAVLDDVSTALPWELVELFSTMPRWEPKDVNRSADEIVSRLKAHDVPVTVHQPDLYLSIPFSAEIRTADGTLRAKPPAYSVNMPDGLEAELVYVPAKITNKISTDCSTRTRTRRRRHRNASPARSSSPRASPSPARWRNSRPTARSA